MKISRFRRFFSEHYCESVKNLFLAHEAEKLAQSYVNEKNVHLESLQVGVVVSAVWVCSVFPSIFQSTAGKLPNRAIQKVEIIGTSLVIYNFLIRKSFALRHFKVLKIFS